MQPSVSVIIPIYNGESYLINTIKYLENQTFKDFEVVFVDDASTDNTFSKLCEAAKKSSINMRIEQMENNSGCAMARNHGIRVACGKYVLCLDADDYYYPNLLDRLYQATVKHQPDVVVFASWMIDGATGEKRSFGQWRRLEQLLEDDSTEYVCDEPANQLDIAELIDYVAWSKMIKRDYFILNNLWFSKFEYYEDISYSFISVLKSKRTVFITEKMLDYYRNTPTGMTSWRRPKEHYMVDAFHLILMEFKDNQTLYKGILNRALKNINAMYLNPETSEEDKSYIMNKMMYRCYYEWCIDALSDMDASYDRFEIVKNIKGAENRSRRYFIPVLKGDKVGICAMSNPVESNCEIEAIDNFLEDYGLMLNIGDLSQSVEGKAEEINSLFADPNLKYIFDVSGGDLANEVIEVLDYETIKTSNAIFVGYSDLTVVINAIYKMTGKASILYRINNVIKDKSKIQSERINKTLFRGAGTLFEFDYIFYRGNFMKGIVVGGNIRCLLKLAGTVYWPDFNGKILFIESQDEDFVTVRAELAQLKQIGVFSKIAGMIIGLFGMDSKTDNSKIDECILSYLGDDVPVAKTKEIGHSFSSKAIVIGGSLELRCKDVG